MERRCSGQRRSRPRPHSTLRRQTAGSHGPDEAYATVLNSFGSARRGCIKDRSPDRWPHPRPASSRSAPPRTPTSSSTSSKGPIRRPPSRSVTSLREPRTTIGGVNLVAGFRPELWAAVTRDASPDGHRGIQRSGHGSDRLRPAGDAARHRHLADGRRLRRRVRPVARRRHDARRSRAAGQRDGRLAVPP